MFVFSHNNWPGVSHFKVKDLLNPADVTEANGAT